MSKQHEALRLALDALDCIYSPLHVREINKVGAAITALREALAEQPAQQEPVYFCDYGYEGWGKVDADMAAANIADGMTVEAYYASPPAQRKPLTDEEIEDVWQGLKAKYIEEVDSSYWGCCDFEFARAIEAKLKERNT